jgi:hypothetical protein
MQRNLEVFNMFISISASLLSTVFISLPKDANRKSPTVAYVPYIADCDILASTCSCRIWSTTPYECCVKLWGLCCLQSVVLFTRTYALVTHQMLCSDTVTPGWFVMHEICHLYGPDLRISHQWYWRLESSRMWHYVGRLVPDVSTQHYITGDLTLNLTGL